jgi:hypothetical protein
LIKYGGQRTSSTSTAATPAGTNGSKETKEVETESSTKFRQDELGFLNFSGRFRAKRTFGLTSDISGDTFLLAKETNVPGFLGASQGRFESDSGTFFFRPNEMKKIKEPFCFYSELDI